MPPKHTASGWLRTIYRERCKQGYLSLAKNAKTLAGNSSDSGLSSASVNKVQIVDGTQRLNSTSRTWGVKALWKTSQTSVIVVLVKARQIATSSSA